MLNGKKSYLGAVALFVIGGLVYLGVLDQKTAESLAMAVGGFSVYALRDAVKKLE